MEDYAEPSHFEDDQFAYNGEEYQEDFQDLEHHHQQLERKNFDSERGFEPNDNVGTAGNGIKHSIGHRDSASAGLVRFLFLFFIDCSLDYRGVLGISVTDRLGVLLIFDETLCVLGLM
jgi:hypothetical protein